MIQLKIKNDSIKSFVISTEGRNLSSFAQEIHFLDVSYSFDMTKNRLVHVSNTPLNPLSRGDSLDLSSRPGMSYFNQISGICYWLMVIGFRSQFTNNH